MDSKPEWRWLVQAGSLTIEIQAADVVSAIMRATELGCTPTQILLVA
jgi:hypothetical protein